MRRDQRRFHRPLLATMLALATDRAGRRGLGPREGMARVKTRVAVASVVRDRGREMYSAAFEKSDGHAAKEHIADLFKD